MARMWLLQRFLLDPSCGKSMLQVMNLLQFPFPLRSAALVCFVLFVLAGCGQPLAVVDSGTYEGTIQKVVPEEAEIYVTLDSGEQLELYFNEQTRVTQAGVPADFSAITEGAAVRITLSREGNRNIPEEVELL
jgi:hypothetical protein